jgi:hypothetical protein
MRDLFRSASTAVRVYGQQPTLIVRTRPRTAADGEMGKNRPGERGDGDEARQEGGGNEQCVRDWQFVEEKNQIFRSAGKYLDVARCLFINHALASVLVNSVVAFKRSLFSRAHFQWRHLVCVYFRLLSATIASGDLALWQFGNLLSTSLDLFRRVCRTCVCKCI